MAQTSHRIQLALTPTAYRILGRIKRLSGASSVTEVVRGALATIQWLQDRISEGYEIVIEKNGQRITVTPLLPFPLAPGGENDGTETRERKPATSVQ